MDAPSLLAQPEEYAKRAISVLEHQLSTAKSPQKIAKLTSRIVEWKTLLSIMEKDNDRE